MSWEEIPFKETNYNTVYKVVTKDLDTVFATRFHGELYGMSEDFFVDYIEDTILEMPIKIYRNQDIRIKATAFEDVLEIPHISSVSPKHVTEFIKDLRTTISVFGDDLREIIVGLPEAIDQAMKIVLAKSDAEAAKLIKSVTDDDRYTWIKLK